MLGNAIPQLDSSLKGIHLFWTGPLSWVYSPGGWNIQRRKAPLRKPQTCAALDQAAIERIRMTSEQRITFGWVSWRRGSFNSGNPSTITIHNPVTPAEIFTLNLDAPQPYVRVNMKVKLGFSFGLFQGKVVTEVKPPSAGSFAVELRAAQIDQIVSYTLDPQSLQYCIYSEPDDKSWEEIPFLVKGLQLPAQELIPTLLNSDDEFALAKTRLLPGESIVQDGFHHIISVLRESLKNGSPRPIDKIILARENTEYDFEELQSTVPLLTMLAHPMWRRVMGLGYFDQDSLEENAIYEYRITGFFPNRDIADKVYGFHTISSGTALPVCFFLADIMFRFSKPPVVRLAPGTPMTGKQQLSRRGIAIENVSEHFWNIPSLSDWNLVLDFPTPLQRIEIEFHPGHSLQYQYKTAGNAISSIENMPAGATVNLSFPALIRQLRIKGKGFLFTIAIPGAGPELTPVSFNLPPVQFINRPVLQAVTSLQAENLQKIAAATADDNNISVKPSRAALGFELKWTPLLQDGLTFWPPEEPHAPPLESTLYQVEHRQLPSGDWKPLLPFENWLSGNRREQGDKKVIHYGADLMLLFPESPQEIANGDNHMYWDDIFDFSPEGNPVERPIPPPGTDHQYRIRAIDIIGRPGVSWTESNNISLQKLIPPPVPVGPSPAIVESAAGGAKNGVHTRLLVRDAPDLIPAEISQLGTDDNLIILKWGWHAEQRKLDPFTKEFRVYVHNGDMDIIKGDIQLITDLGNGRFELQLQLVQSVKINEAARSFLRSNNYPFFIRSHEAGQLIKMIVERRVPDASGNLSGPVTGAILLPVLLKSNSLKPASWTQRVGIVPVTAATTYSFEIRNVLNLTVTNNRDEVWVGVSAADDQPYVTDTLFPVDNRPGNESPVVPVKVQGKFQGKPVFQIPVPLEDIPVIHTREPEKEGVSFAINPDDYLDTGTLASVSHIRLERVAAGFIFGTYKIENGNRILAVGEKNQPDVEVFVPNPSDKQNIIAALSKVNVDGLADRYLLFLAGSHPYRDTLFEPVHPEVKLKGTITDILPPKHTRYIYRVKAGNHAGAISAGDAMLKAVVRVPSLNVPQPPEYLRNQHEAANGIIKLSIKPEPDISHVIIFYSALILPGTEPIASSQLVRIANRRDLSPDKSLSLRNGNGLYANKLLKEIDEADTEENGQKIISFKITDDPGTVWRVWACTVTTDSIPSTPAGPWRIKSVIN